MASSDFAGFRPATIKFLKDLEKNNERDWFNDNKHRYEQDVLDPALAFIEAMGPKLRKISPHFRAIPKRTGGSLIRIYRDTRFAKDKTPYKTNIGIHFRHEQGKDVHAPGFYVHVEPREVFLGAGLWRPDPDALGRIREMIDTDSKSWLKVRDDKAFRANFELHGDSLKRPPKGYDADHPRIEDLKRKDFLGLKSMKISDIHDAAFVDKVTDAFAAAKPFMRFLCKAVDVPI